MNRLGMLVDVSHIATAGFWDVIETSTKPIIATHSNAKTLCSHPRNLNDDQIKAINANDGLIGITFAGQFLEDHTGQSVSARICSAGVVDYSVAGRQFFR